MQYRPLVIAHDGCDGAPAHSLAAVLRAVELGADIVEVDIRVTRDGVVVLHHDDALALGGRIMRLSEATRDEVDELLQSDRTTTNERRPMSDSGIVTLDVVLELARSKGTVVNLDIKEDAAVEPTVALVRRHNMVESVLFSGCEWSRARSLKSHNRDCQVLLNASRAEYERAAVDPEGFVESLCHQAAEAGCCGLNVYHTFCTHELVDTASLRFLPVSAWTVDETEEMRRIIGLGVSAITTNRVAALRKVLETSVS